MSTLTSVNVERPALSYDPLSGSPFYRALRTRIDGYFKSRGISKHATPLMWFKAAFFFLWMAGSYAAIYLPGLERWQLFLLFISMGMGSAFMVITIAHDASHMALSRHAWLNRLLSYVWNLVGISSYLWELRHNLSHHNFTNVPGYDPDISQSRLVRLNPDAPYHPAYRFQHIYAPFLYALLSINLVYIKDFSVFRETHFGNRVIAKHPLREWIIMLLTKAFYLSYSLVLPILLLDHHWAFILLCYFALHAVGGIWIALVLVPPHINGIAEYTLPADGSHIHTCFATHQLQSTVDLAPDSALLNWFTGGLNTHVIHHVFPGICHIHYRALTPILRETALEYGLPYRSSGFLKAMRNHFHFLRVLGQHPEKAQIRQR